MKTNKILRLLLLGFLIWLIPFVTSFGFFDRSGKLSINYDLFKSIMIVISSLVGCYAIIRYYKSVHHNFAKEGMITGLVWLGINLLLDLIILIPMSEMPYPEYFNSIGLRYLQIPVICMAVGLLLERKLILKN